MAQAIYLDHSATTPVRPEVLEAMLPWFAERFGNAGSIHASGRAARAAVDRAREQVATLINADPREVFFTSGGTEADNLAIRGVLAAGTRRRVIVSAVEHHAVLHAADYIRRYDGADVVVAGVDASGRVDPDEVAAQITGDTAVVSVMHANNETGVVQPVDRIAAVCAERGVPFHTDAVQSAGRIPLDVQAVPVGLVALSAHKLYGPKGIGACYIRKGVTIVPQAVGGAQERGRRAGTENVPAIVGFGVACELARAELAREAERLARLRDRLETGILAATPDARVNGARDARLPHVLNVGFPGADGESLILALDMEGIAVSSGSACTAGSLDPSHVLLAMGQSHADAQSALRFSLGRANTDADIDRVLALLPQVVGRVRAARERV
jgi:cysteine desulfurase